MSKILSLPSSGIVLAKVVEAFDLRRWDTEGLLSAKTGTTARFFRGERVGDRAGFDICLAVGRALIDSGLLPPVLLKGAPLPEALAGTLQAAHPGVVLGAAIFQYGERWDELVGALRRASAPIASERPAWRACLQLVTIDLSVRLTALFWLTRSAVEEPRVPWLEPEGMQGRLRELQAMTDLSRDRLAEECRVDAHTLDAWLDKGVRPKDENLQDLANVCGKFGGPAASDLLIELRRGFGCRALFDELVELLGLETAAEMAVHLVSYAMWMLQLPHVSTKSVEENDLKMHLALTIGTLGRGRLELSFVDSMLNHVWRNEVDPLWRTSLKAVSRSWFERMQEVASRLPPQDVDALTEMFGTPLSETALEAIAMSSLASKAEITRDPRMRAAMAAVMADEGRFAALEWKLQGTEAANRGDLLGAINLFRQGVEQAPQDAELHFRLGAGLWQIGDVANGLMELEIAAQLEPQWDRAHVEVGIVLLNENRDEEAMRRLEAARALLPTESTWLLLHLAFAYERLGNELAAIENYEKLLGLQPDHAEPLDRLAHLLFLTGDKRQGAALTKKAAHLGFTDVFSAWSNGYYDRKGIRARPPRTTPRHLVQLGA